MEEKNLSRKAAEAQRREDKEEENRSRRSSSLFFFAPLRLCGRGSSLLGSQCLLPFARVERKEGVSGETPS
jgi:hypothetical protein